MKSKAGINTIYYDIENGDNIIHQWLEDAFYETCKMKDDNLIADVWLEVPLNKKKTDLDSMEIVGFLAVDAIAFDRETVIAG